MCGWLSVNREGHSKRWYKNVEVSPEQTDSVTRYRIRLDDRRVLTPAENYLWAPNERLALAVAAEWQNQTTYVQPFTMPLVRARRR